MITKSQLWKLLFWVVLLGLFWLTTVGLSQKDKAVIRVEKLNVE